MRVSEMRVHLLTATKHEEFGQELSYERPKDEEFIKSSDQELSTLLVLSGGEEVELIKSSVAERGGAVAQVLCDEQEEYT
jgi:hypothetical protein